VRFRFSNEHIGLGPLVGPRDQNLRSIPHLLRELPDCRGKSHAGEEMRAHALRQITTAPRTQIRATRKKVGGQFVESKSQVAGRATSDGVLGAVNENETSLGWGQCLMPPAINMRQAAVGEVDYIGRCDWLRAPRTLCMHGADLALGK
jgi:hypothetical protein